MAGESIIGKAGAIFGPVTEVASAGMRLATVSGENETSEGMANTLCELLQDENAETTLTPAGLATRSSLVGAVIGPGKREERFQNTALEVVGDAAMGFVPFVGWGAMIAKFGYEYAIDHPPTPEQKLHIAYETVTKPNPTADDIIGLIAAKADPEDLNEILYHMSSAQNGEPLGIIAQKSLDKFVIKYAGPMVDEKKLSADKSAAQQLADNADKMELAALVLNDPQPMEKVASAGSPDQGRANDDMVARGASSEDIDDTGFDPEGADTSADSSNMVRYDEGGEFTGSPPKLANPSPAKKGGLAGKKGMIGKIGGLVGL